jgi:hypothetical protein
MKQHPKLKASLAEIAGLKADLCKEQRTLNRLTHQFNSKTKESKIRVLHMVVTTTKYHDALLELKATKEVISKLSIDLIIARNLVSENALFAEYVKEELYATTKDIVAVNEENIILKGMSLLTEIQATLYDDASKKKSVTAKVGSLAKGRREMEEDQ